LGELLFEAGKNSGGGCGMGRNRSYRPLIAIHTLKRASGMGEKNWVDDILGSHSYWFIEV
jgi:hypothetical protein